LTLDPLQNRFASWTNSATATTTTNHYADDGDSTAWSSTGNGTWVRNVTGLDGQLAATVTSASISTLQLTDLHGDVLATVSPAADGAPSAMYAYTEFGNNETVAAGSVAYGYLGADQRSSQALGGTQLMGVRIYNPTSGRCDQVDRVLGGNANPYDYVFQNPLTRFDLSGLKSGKNYDAFHWHWWGVEWELSRSTAQFFVLIVAFVNTGWGQLGFLINLLPPPARIAVAVLRGYVSYVAGRVGIQLHKHPNEGVIVKIYFGYPQISSE
jgi:RHS repeat-associated protein